MKDSPPPAKRRRYDAAFRVEVLRLTGESRSTQAAARAQYQPQTALPVAERGPHARRGGSRGRFGPGHGGGVAPAAGVGFGRLWSRLKTEVLEVRERHVFADLADAQASVADYFDYYNHERLHSSIGYHTPYHTHQPLLQTNALNCPA